MESDSNQQASDELTKSNNNWPEPTEHASDDLSDDHSRTSESEETNSASNLSENEVNADGLESTSVLKAKTTTGSKTSSESNDTIIDHSPPSLPGEITSSQNNLHSSQPVGSSKALPKKRRLPSKFVMMLLAILIIGCGSAAAVYFGYYMNPNTVWSESLLNTGQGYNKLVSYLNAESSAHYSGFTENGSFTVKASGNSYSGSLIAQSQGQNSTGSLKLDIGITNLDIEERSVQSGNASQPDAYLQISGIKPISGYFGPELGPKIDTLDEQWIEIDHSLITDLDQQFTKQMNTAQGTTPKLTWEDVNSFLKAASSVNQKYLFTTNSATAVTKVLKFYGQETVDGHHTFHYKVGFNGAHVEAYVGALCSALMQSNLGTYLTQENFASDVQSACKNTETSATKINDSDTVDVWADSDTRLIYKVRISDTSNPAANFVDIGLNYKGGESYPFFISGQSKQNASTQAFSVVFTLNSQTNSVTMNTTIASSGTGSPLELSGTFTVQPSNKPVSVSPPVHTQQLTSVLNILGLGQELTQLENLSLNTNGNSLIPTSGTSL